MASDTQHPEVPGLRIAEGFLPPREQIDLLSAIDAQPWDHSLRRRTQHYGWRYAYGPGDAGEFLGPLPGWLERVARRIAPGFDQCIVNEYEPGQGIAAHADNPRLFGPRVAGLSLGSATTMEFRRPGRPPVEVRLRPGSLYVMEGDARYLWTHEIAKRKTDKVDGRKVRRGRRVSVTFRSRRPTVY